jgi:hypothetical protein
MILSVIHFILILGEISYVFVIEKNPLWDSWYMIFILCKFMSWIVFRGKCILTYYADEKNERRDIRDIRDIHQILFFLTDSQMRTFINIVLLMVLYNLIVIQLRSDILPVYLFVTFILTFSFYLLALRNVFSRSLYVFLQKNTSIYHALFYGCLLFLCGCIGYILYRLMSPSEEDANSHGFYLT